MNCLPSNVVQVDFIEYHPGSHVKRMYEKQKKDFAAQGHNGASWVFHGTNISNMSKIIELGFKVGGSEGVGIVNGC